MLCVLRVLCACTEIVYIHFRLIQHDYDKNNTCSLSLRLSQLFLTQMKKLALQLNAMKNRRLAKSLVTCAIKRWYTYVLGVRCCIICNCMGHVFIFYVREMRRAPAPSLYDPRREWINMLTSLFGMQHIIAPFFFLAIHSSTCVLFSVAASPHVDVHAHAQIHHSSVVLLCCCGHVLHAVYYQVMCVRIHAVLALLLVFTRSRNRRNETINVHTFESLISPLRRCRSGKNNIVSRMDCLYMSYKIE